MLNNTAKTSRSILLGLLGVLIILQPVNTVAAATNSKSLTGPIRAQVIRVIDGDTLQVRVKIWLDQELTVFVRIGGIDAPEKRSPDQYQKLAAWKAYKALFRLTDGRKITLTNIRRGKYSGRVIADLHLSDGTNIARELLKLNLVSPYRSKSKSKNFCKASNCLVRSAGKRTAP